MENLEKRHNAKIIYIVLEFIERFRQNINELYNRVSA